MKKSITIYAFALMISGMTAYFYPNEYFAALFYLVLFVPVFSLLTIFYVYIRFKFLHKLDRQQATKGDTIIYTYSIYNEDIIPYPEMKIVFEGEHLIFKGQIVSPAFILTPRGRHDINITLHCKYRGLYSVGAKYIELVDFFNMFRFRFRKFTAKTILVYPRILYFRNFYIRRTGNFESGIKDKRKVLSNQSLAEIKDYEYGEKLSYIHWKMTARFGKLMSRKMESITDERYVVYMDLYRSDHDIEERLVLEDKLIEVFVAFINAIMLNSIPFDLKYMMSEGFRDEKYLYRSQFEYFYEQAAKMRFSKEMDICEIISVSKPELSSVSLNQGKLFVFTFNMSDKLIELLEKNVNQGYEVIIFYVSPRELPAPEGYVPINEKGISRFAARAGIRLYTLDISDNIENMLDGEVL